MRSAISFAVAARREDVLIADHHQRRHVDVAQLVGELVGGVEDAPHLGSERVGRASHRQWPQPTERGEQAPERARPDDPAGGLAGHRAHAALLRRRHPALQQLAAPRRVAARGAGERQRQHPRRVAHGHDLADRPTHRGTDDMGCSRPRRDREPRRRRRPSARSSTCRTACRCDRRRGCRTRSRGSGGRA